MYCSLFYRGGGGGGGRRGGGGEEEEEEEEAIEDKRWWESLGVYDGYGNPSFGDSLLNRSGRRWLDKIDDV